MNPKNNHPETVHESNVCTYPVMGMTCAACAVSLESYLGRLMGVETVVVSYPNQSVYVKYYEKQLSESRLIEAAKEIGYELLAGGTMANNSDRVALHAAEQLQTLKAKLTVASICTIPIFVISMFFMNQVPHEGIIQLILAIPVVFFSGRDFYLNAYKKVKHLQSNMDTLVALSTATAFIHSTYQVVCYYNASNYTNLTSQGEHFYNNGTHPHFYFESATVIITLILLGKFLEERAKKQSAQAIKNLLELQPTEAIVVRNNQETTIAITDILLGDLVIIKPGSRIPVDGKIRSGNSYIDESAITGEPIAAFKDKGNLVFAGSINQQGTLKILAQKIGDQTLLSQIVLGVQQALGSKPQIQQLADRISAIFVPTVLGLALTSALFWLIFPFNTPNGFALNAFINVLIIACPCALGLATPTAIMVGIGKGAKLGILIKDAQSLELANKLTDIVFDKTGTLTEGKPQVNEFYTFAPPLHNGNQTLYSAFNICQIFFEIEKQSEHPLAPAVLNYLRGQYPEITNNTSDFTLTQFHNQPGLGIIAEFNDTQYKLGSWDWIAQSTQKDKNYASYAAATACLRNAQTTVALACGDQILAVVGISDTIKTDAIMAIAQLKQQNIAIHLLTGDNPQTAKYLADALGIKNVVAQAKPNTKLQYIQTLQSQQRKVAMVGDGINDAQALTQSDVSFAMATGTALAMESAGITLMGSKIMQIPQAIALSKQTLKTIHTNLIWAFGYNVLAIPLAMGIFFPFGGIILNPMIGAAAMSFSSISVVLNSLWLSHKKIK